MVSEVSLTFDYLKDRLQEGRIHERALLYYGSCFEEYLSALERKLFSILNKTPKSLYFSVSKIGINKTFHFSEEYSHSIKSPSLHTIQSAKSFSSSAKTKITYEHHLKTDQKLEYAKLLGIQHLKRADCDTPLRVVIDLEVRLFFGEVVRPADRVGAARSMADLLKNYLESSQTIKVDRFIFSIISASYKECRKFEDPKKSHRDRLLEEVYRDLFGKIHLFSKKREDKNEFSIATVVNLGTNSFRYVFTKSEIRQLEQLNISSDEISRLTSDLPTENALILEAHEKGQQFYYKDWSKSRNYNNPRMQEVTAIEARFLRPSIFAVPFEKFIFLFDEQFQVKNEWLKELGLETFQISYASFASSFRRTLVRCKEKLNEVHRIINRESFQEKRGKIIGAENSLRQVEVFAENLLPDLIRVVKEPDDLSHYEKLSSLLLVGPSGTGKTTHIHYLRKIINQQLRNELGDKTFTKLGIETELPGELDVNSARLSGFADHALAVSEIFGSRQKGYHIDGVLEKIKPGQILLLDEIGDMDAFGQARLLKVIEERSFSPIQSNEKSFFKGVFTFATWKTHTLRRDFLFRISDMIVRLNPLKDDHLKQIISDKCDDFGLPKEPILKAIVKKRVLLQGNIRQVIKALQMTLMYYHADPKMKLGQSFIDNLELMNDCLEMPEALRKNTKERPYMDWYPEARQLLEEHGYSKPHIYKKLTESGEVVLLTKSNKPAGQSAFFKYIGKK